MEELAGIIEVATAKIASEYFHLPLHGADSVYRERVYCYELYHQMRVLWPDNTAYRLNGEVDKAARPYFQDGTAPKPDLLVHEPGTGRNYAVIEVKSSLAIANGITKDYKTLMRFTSDFGYTRGIYLLYGAEVQAAVRIAKHIALETVGSSDHIELWIHAQAGAPAVRAR